VNANLTYATLIQQSALFDPAWYLARYPDVAAAGLDPLQHFLRYGMALGRDPGPGFDTRYYLASFPDVARAGVPPFIHYLQHGVAEGRSPAAAVVTPQDCAERIDIVVPVYNALADVKVCLASLREKRDGFAVRVIVVNDGSDAETTAWLREYCPCDPVFTLIEHPHNKGYTQAVNTGLRASDAPYVITQNSDTIATSGWLRGLVRCINSAPEIGIAGPLSNAASWQNVPSLYDETGAFAVNDIPGGRSPDEMALLVARASSRAYPRLPFVNGFCFMIKRAVIDAIGYMDEANFPVGYGEENDFCIRAADAGFKLAIADDTYVFHAKSKSFGHSRRKELSKQGSETLKRKHGKEKFAALVERVKQTEPLDRVRAALQQHLTQAAAPGAGEALDALDALAMKILFLLPVKGGSGGAHSVVQEVCEMRRLGMQARVAVKAPDLEHLCALYQDVPGVAELFVGFTPATLIGLAEDYDIVVATTFNSVSLLKKVVDACPHILPAYYVQDYEPMFFPEGSEHWQVARDSYTLIPGALQFAKTHWIAGKVQQEHGVQVAKVAPSIDHDCYRPRPRLADGRIHVSAMIRPQTPRRGAERTMRLFERLAAVHGDQLCFHLFGCDSEDERFQALPRNFAFENRGVLKRPEVAALLAESDVFVDLSDYQAFGRTALEAMACGATAMLPVHGGGDEYARDGVNAIVVDSFDEEACFQRLDALLRAPETLQAMRRASLLTAAAYSVHQAAVSELVVFAEALASHQSVCPRRVKPTLHLFPGRQKGGSVSGSGFVRVLFPFAQAAIRREWAIRELAAGELPAPEPGAVIVIQRDAGDLSLAQLQAWAADWRAAGGRIVYEVDDDLLDAKGLQQRGAKGDTAALAAKVRWLAGAADAVTVSTPALLERFKPINPRTHIVPNRLDAELWRIGKPRLSGPGVFTRQPGDPIRIGYIGTPTHDQDLAVIAEAMRRIEQEYGKRVEIEVIGAFQHSTPLFGKRVGLPKRNDYPGFVDWLQRRVHWDIGVIPLADDAFNRSKSHLKFLEYAALGLSAVVSRVESYTSVCRHEENALLVDNSTEAWVQALRRLIEDEGLRQRLAEAACKELMQTYLLDLTAKELIGVLAETASCRRRKA
jgi:GT2 family glycosyltransferase/glycosyltransferase involved in cell wall biosynthesis